MEDPYPESIPLTEGALRLHDILPPAEVSAWAGTRSQLYMVPFDKATQTFLEKRAEEANHSPLHPPQDSQQAALWPYNALVDWLWGSRIFRKYGTKDLKDYSQRSLVSKAIEDYRFRLSSRKPKRGLTEELLRESRAVKKPTLSAENA